MCEDLINLLRRCGKQKCKDCEYEYVLGCVTKMNEKAADAIEELNYKYQKALGDLAKQPEPLKEET